MESMGKLVYKSLAASSVTFLYNWFWLDTEYNTISSIMRVLRPTHLIRYCGQYYVINMYTI